MRRRGWSLWFVGLGLAGCGTTPPPYEPISAPATISRIEPTLLDEASGIAASRRDDNLLWALNDSGNHPFLFALDGQGNSRGRARILDVANHDWEDLATFELDGRSWILIADVGDNLSRRDDAQLLLIEEPAPARIRRDRDLQLPVTARMPVRFPDGARDCEAVAVDPASREILLISKRTSPPVAYRLPLTIDPEEAARAPLAEVVAPLDRLPRPDVLQLILPTPSGHLRSQPTSLDVTADGRLAAVLTYGEVWLYPRGNDESWTAAFRRLPQRLPPHELSQAEAVTFWSDGRSVLVTSEGLNAPLVRYRLPDRRENAPSAGR